MTNNNNGWVAVDLDGGLALTLAVGLLFHSVWMLNVFNVAEYFTSQGAGLKECHGTFVTRNVSILFKQKPLPKDVKFADERSKLEEAWLPDTSPVTGNNAVARRNVACLMETGKAGLRSGERRTCPPQTTAIGENQFLLETTIPANIAVSEVETWKPTTSNRGRSFLN